MSSNEEIIIEKWTEERLNEMRILFEFATHTHTHFIAHSDLAHCVDIMTSFSKSFGRWALMSPWSNSTVYDCYYVYLSMATYSMSKDSKRRRVEVKIMNSYFVSFIVVFTASSFHRCTHFQFPASLYWNCHEKCDHGVGRIRNFDCSFVSEICVLLLRAHRQPYILVLELGLFPGSEVWTYDSIVFLHRQTNGDERLLAVVFCRMHRVSKYRLQMEFTGII